MYALGVNVQNRGGKPRTRPPFDHVELTFENIFDRRHFFEGKFQGGKTFQLGDNDQILVVIRGKVFRIDVETGFVENMASVIGLMNEYQDRCYFCQVENQMVIQDGINTPIIVTASGGYRSDPSNFGVPVGRRMAYGQGRLFVQVGDRVVRPGNIFSGNDTTTPLRFTEWLNQGGLTLSLQQQYGDITALGFVPLSDSPTGVGEFIISGRFGMRSFRVDLPMNVWATTNQFSLSVAMGAGAISHDSWTNNNNDVFYRAFDGERSLRLTRQEQNGWSDMPISQELGPLMQLETDWLLPFVSSVAHDNRVFVTAVGRGTYVPDSDGYLIPDYYFRGMYELDVLPAGSLSGRLPPSWDGIWTGPNPMCCLSARLHGQPTLYVIGKDYGTVNALYVQNLSGLHDDSTKRIPCYLFWGNKDFGKAFENKLLDTVEIWAEEIRDQVDFSILYRGPSAPVYLQWGEVTWRARAYSDPLSPKVMSQQSRSRARFSCPKQETTGQTGALPDNRGENFDFAFRWRGHMMLHKGRLTAQEQNAPPGSAQSEATFLECVGQPTDELSYQIAEPVT